MDNETSYIEEQVLVCESVDELKGIIAKLNSYQQMWKNKINKILSDSGLLKSELADMCGVSKMSVSKWCNGSVPRNRETFIKIGLAAGYQISQMDELLERYGRFPGLYSRTLEDCVCMYVLKNVETSNVKERCDIYSNLVEEIRAEIIDGGDTDKEYQTDKFTEQLNIVSNVDELKAFVRENAKEFKRAYNKLYAYIKAFLYANNSNPYDDEVHFSINDLANKQGWSASLRKCVYAVNVGKWYPTRNKIISLGLHLNMDHDEVDEMLSLANMEKLYAKNPFELAIIYILEDAVLNNMVCTNGSDKLCQYARSVLEQLDIPGIEEFLSEL